MGEAAEDEVEKKKQEAAGRRLALASADAQNRPMTSVWKTECDPTPALAIGCAVGAAAATSARSEGM